MDYADEVYMRQLDQVWDERCAAERIAKEAAAQAQETREKRCHDLANRLLAEPTLEAQLRELLAYQLEVIGERNVALIELERWRRRWAVTFGWLLGAVVVIIALLAWRVWS